MPYLDDLRVVGSGATLHAGGRIVATLITAARERGIAVSPELRTPRVSISPDELPELLTISRAVAVHPLGAVPRQHELEEFLRGAAESEIELDPIALDDEAWLADALTYYQRLGFLVDGVPDAWPPGDVGLTHSHAWERWSVIERALLACDKRRTVTVPGYPWKMVPCCTRLMSDLKALTSDAVAIEITSIETREDLDASRHAFMNDDIVSFGLRIGAHTADATFYYTKYVLLVSDALASINRLLTRVNAAARFRLVNDSTIVFITARDQESVARDRGVDFRDP